MYASDYIPARSVEQAVEALGAGKGRARALAGGTDLIVQVRENKRALDAFIDIKHIPDLNVLEIGGDGSLRLGAAVPCAVIYENPAVRKAFPALVDSASLIGGTQIQSRATVGGNLANSSPAADSIPALLALGATCLVAGPSGTRTVDAAGFCTGPGRNVLSDNEILVELRFPAPPNGSTLFGARFLRFIPRNEMDIAVANAAASVVLEEGGRRFRSARIAVGAVAPTPLLVQAAGDALAGQPVSAESFDRAVEAVRAAAVPITDMRGSIVQRKHLVGVMARRAIEGAVERALAS